MTATPRAAAVDARDVGAFITAALDDAELDPFAFRIYARLARRAGAATAWESVPNMAAACRMSVRRARQALRDLEARHMVDAEPRPGDSTEYRLTGRETWTDPGTTCRGDEADPGTTCRPPRQEVPPTPASGAGDPGTTCRQRESLEGSPLKEKPFKPDVPSGRSGPAGRSSGDDVTVTACDEPLGKGRHRRRCLRPAGPSGRCDVCARFEQFADRYPRHPRTRARLAGASPAVARAAWHALSAADRDAVARAVAHVAGWQAGPSPPMATTWLNDPDRWRPPERQRPAPNHDPGDPDRAATVQARQQRLAELDQLHDDGDQEAA